jgi:hypothetical protein
MTQQLTPNYQLPYYQASDPADGATQQQALAQKLDTVLLASASASAAAAVPVLDVGLTGQIRAGRQLAVADFTSMGLGQPRGLWNLSNLTNLGSDGRALVNKGTVTFSPGINGAASTAAQFTGSTSQALYIADSGAADPYRISTGSWGCWFRTAKRGTAQGLIAKRSAAAGQYSWMMAVDASNIVQVPASADGTTLALGNCVSDVVDDRWHFIVGTHDGAQLRAYVDCVLEAMVPLSGALFASNGPVNIGAFTADGATAAVIPHYGRVDEAFVTADVLSEDQIRSLYAAKLTHTLGVVPTGVRLNVRRRRKGATLAVADFTTTPLRLHNFSTVLPNNIGPADEGSNGVALNYISGQALPVAGADGRGGAGDNTGAVSLVAGQWAATDAGLPAALTPRSYGCWFKTTILLSVSVVAWGTTATADARLIVTSTGAISAGSSGDFTSGPYVSDGQWHLGVVTEDNAAGDGVRRKVYLDGRLVGGSTVMNTITLAGANRFRIGANPDGTSPFTGQVDGAFVTGYAMTTDEVLRLYAKGSQALAPSPKNAGDHVEALTSDGVLFIGDTLESQHTVDLGVTA